MDGHSEILRAIRRFYRRAHMHDGFWWTRRYPAKWLQMTGSASSNIATPTRTRAVSAMFCVIERFPAHVMTTDRTSPTTSAVRTTTIAVRIGLIGSVG